ncbi:ABC transporter substrate-binding protein [Geobacter sp. FeAm09]|uniref:ABC transporter substrate-binding protein n=1 Tax=Geobacter sp. FeAm09 TaxID=2597769 RepID=UPI00143D251E|nr:ABC transporter substrate-binding protein [Geobacter sp. FeAm09]
MGYTSFVRIVVCTWLCLPWLFGMAGCSREASAPLQIATNVWPGYEPLYLARALGYCPESAVRFHEMTSAADVLKAFRNHAIDAAALTLDEALLLVQDGIDVRVLFVTDISHGADAILARPGIGSVRDLKGKRVGVESMALGAYVLTRALDQAGLAPRDVTIVPVAVQEHERAYATGEIDAAVTFEPARTRLLALGARSIFDSRRIPDEIVDVVVVRADILRTRSDQVKALEDGWFRALKYLRANPDHTARLMGMREGLTGAQFSAALAGLVIPDRNENDRLLSGALLPPARRLADVMFRGKLLERPVDPARLVVRRP